MRTARATRCVALRFYRRFDYDAGQDNHLKDFASALALGVFTTAFVLWVWMLCVEVASYRVGYPL
ncbi:MULTISPECIES: hypothetical protein [unclassified Pseudovibrio]|uniref:hypothetical protein n=1 Tax=unclassified Pseudovibrio TaxID=2627060 RepID=UPI0007AE9524|nr:MULTISPECIES: hypothetical protein [unclassified Pseudovibrio]KZL05550.1 hypothetical protein PsAD26_04347 [Pseudovibrio sp. Ad26]KZL25644.1 hypothetical protein PsAD37_02238 [Pseudovibrio sp. Ad37]